ncbi:Cna B-type domain-containing protein, partial [Streptococcus zalophi]|uniref:Cna B-type domain-containing protein n=1 Tax=Streptococcus zalophi TaxID=640031 RepID=UPI00215BDB19
MLKDVKKILSLLFLSLVTVIGLSLPGQTVYTDGVGASTTNLNELLTNVDIDAEVDADGNYIVYPDGDYGVTFHFAENQTKQFSDEEEMIYTLPAGLTVGPVGETTFSIHIIDSEGEVDVNNNTYRVEGNQLKVKFNKNDPNFTRLTKVANIEFAIEIKGKIAENITEIQFNENIIKKFVVNIDSDITIEKSGTYNKDTGMVDYQLTIKSKGINKDVVITDTISGTALTFNNDVVITSNKTNPLPHQTTQVGNGFETRIERLGHGEEVVVKYSATVNHDAIAEKGTVEETKNTATVKSDKVPDPKSIEFNLENKIDFSMLAKRVLKQEDKGNNIHEITWKLEINKYMRKTMGGEVIFDKITDVSSKRMGYSGQGIKITVTKPDGSTEVRNIPWSQLDTTTANGKMNSWKHIIPNSDGKFKYEIEYTTEIDMTGAPGTLNFKNNVTVGNYNTTGSINIENGQIATTLAKKAIEVSSKKIKWQITIKDFPSQGHDGQAFIVDDLPKLEHNGKWLRDIFDETDPSKIKVTGLQDQEKYEIIRSSNAPDKNTISIHFYKDEAKHPGLNPTPDGQPRDIVITLETDVDQEWLEYAASVGYKTGEIHTNNTTFRMNTTQGEQVILGAYARAVPKKQSLEKKYLEKSEVEINGVTYPIYKYQLTIEGLSEETPTIVDKFETSYLKYYPDNGIQIRGVDVDDNTFDGGDADISSTNEGIEMTLKNLPKDGSHLYPKYEVFYYLIPKDKAALDQLNDKALTLEEGYPLKNVASWGEFTSDTVVANHTYSPFVDKSLLTEPTIDNGYVATFSIEVNKEGRDLLTNSDKLTLTDKLSDNLRIKLDTVKITPDAPDANIGYDKETNTLTINNLPDSQKLTITYDARVLGKGDATFSNAATLEGKSSKITKTINIETTGGGTGSNPSVTIVKSDKDDYSKKLEGVEFQLFEIVNGQEQAIKDKNGNDVKFVTNENGKVLIQGDQQNLGWVLWADKEYLLRETKTIQGYDITKTDDVKFTLKKQVENNTQYSIVGDEINVTNERPKTEVSVQKKWITSSTNHPDIYLKLYRQIEGGQLEEVPEANVKKLESGTTKVTWTNLYKNDLQDHKYIYSVKEIDENNGSIQLDGDNYLVTYGGTSDKGLTVTNKKLITIAGTKTWDDADNQDGKRPNKVTIILLADGKQIDTQEISEATGWKYQFDNLPEAKGDKKIQYTVKEETVPEYNAVVTGYDITNTHTPSTVNISGKKIWDDANNQDGKRPT